MTDLSEQIFEDIEKLEKRADATDDIRSRVVNKLSDIVDKMHIDTDNESASMIEAKMSAANSLLKALNDVDTSFINRIKLKQKTKVDEDNTQSDQLMSKTIAEFLKQSNVSKVTENITPIASVPDKVDVAEFEILKDELVIGGDTAKDIDV